MDWTLTGGGRLDGAVAPLALSGGRIAETPAPAARRFDATGLMLAPGICDVHGDGFERNLSPRPKVHFDLETALIETDRQLIANGITTAWLALTISWEPGLRGVDSAAEIIAAIERLRPRFAAEIRVQLRWEVFALDAVDRLEDWLAMRPRPVLAFNDHLTGMLKGERILKKLEEYAGRAGVDGETYLALAKAAAARRAEVPAAIARLAARAEALGVPCLAHDEPDAEARRTNRGLGIRVSEFPLTREAAADAIAAGEPTVLGAPNILRGGSHIGAIDAAPAVQEGLCTVLASDYYYPAQLQAVHRLGRDHGIALADAWPLISENAARMGGLTDRGRLDPGQRADIIALDLANGAPSVEAVFAAGHLVHLRDATRLTG